MQIFIKFKHITNRTTKGGFVKKILTLVTALMISASALSAQGISIAPTAGLTIVTGPEEFTNDISEGGYGFSSAPHFGVKGRFSLPLIPLAITGQVLYTSFSGDGEGIITGGVTVPIETESSLLIFGVGAEYNFVPGPISPYLGFDLFYANLGDTKVTSTASNFSYEQTVDGESRTGIGIGGGLQIGIIPLIDVDVAAKYNINNLIGKEDGEETFSTINLSASVSFGF